MSRGLGVVQNEIIEFLTADRPWATIRDLHAVIFQNGTRVRAVSRAAVSRALAKLEGRGLVERFETEFKGRTIQAVGLKAFVEQTINP